MNKHEMLKEFMETFGTPKDPEFWFKLVKEEKKELREALEPLDFSKDRLKQVLKEFADYEYVLHGLALSLSEGDFSEFEVEFAAYEEVANNIYRIVGLLLTAKVFELVHKSNMTKLGPDGKPIRREDGKILKGPNYKEPDLSSIVEALL